MKSLQSTVLLSVQVGCIHIGQESLEPQLLLGASNLVPVIEKLNIAIIRGGLRVTAGVTIADINLFWQNWQQIPN